MNEILDLLPIPAERDFPAGHLEARRDALVAAVRHDAVGGPLARRALRAARGGFARSWLSLLGILALGLALLTLGSSAQQRPVQRDAVAFLAVAGTAQIAIAVAPRVGLRAEA
jgi:hypothetical protein